MKRILCLLGMCVAGAAVSSGGHGGGLDKNGCHNDKKRGDYHCHRGALAGKTFKNKAEAEEALKREKAKPPAKKGT